MGNLGNFTNSNNKYDNKNKDLSNYTSDLSVKNNKTLTISHLDNDIIPNKNSLSKSNRSNKYEQK